MHYTDVTANGVVSLTIGGKITQSKEVTVYAPADIGTATISIGWKDSTGTVNDYVDGALAVGGSKRVRCGEGVELVASILTYSTAFKIGYAN